MIMVLVICMFPFVIVDKYNIDMSTALYWKYLSVSVKKGLQCRHLDGNPTNNNLKNLCWGSYSENHKDAVKHGTSPFGLGEQNHAAKLTEEQVRFIFNAYHDKTHRPGELAKRFGINVDHVSRIARKERWGHLWDD